MYVMFLMLTKKDACFKYKKGRSHSLHFADNSWRSKVAIIKTLSLSRHQTEPTTRGRKTELVSLSISLLQGKNLRGNENKKGVSPSQANNDERREK